MGSPERRALELNEVGWWSKWGRVSWLDDGLYALSSKDFDEPFFNRAGFLDCRASASRLNRAEEAFRRAGRTPHLLVFETCGQASRALKLRGYSQFDGMTVQQAGDSLVEQDDSVRVREVRPKDLTAWCNTYLLSFYGNLELSSRLAPVARRLLRDRRVSLFVADLEGGVVGVTALYRTPGLLGLYCLGTLPAHRNKGVARSLLGFSQRIARREGRTLILQSLRSEETAPFYEKFGFRVLKPAEMPPYFRRRSGMVNFIPRLFRAGDIMAVMERNQPTANG